MTLLSLSAYTLLLSSTINGGEAFGIASPSLVTRSTFARGTCTRVYAEEPEVTPDDYDLLPPEEEEDDADRIEEATELKRKLYQLAASYDRGFSATPNARTEANDIIEQLSTINPTTNAANGIDGDTYGEEVPLKAIWRMIWTSAFDVVSLGASPFAAQSAIYQDIRNPPVAINIIDFIPRAQTFFPSNIAPASLLRAEVTTRASSRKCIPNNRVGLVFEGIKLQPVELLGQKVDNLPPLEISFMWQRNLIEKLIELVPGVDKESLGFAGDDGGTVDADAPGYFDVEYLDDELLVIKQQAPGGLFALVKVDSCDP